MLEEINKNNADIKYIKQCVDDIVNFSGVILISRLDDIKKNTKELNNTIRKQKNALIFFIILEGLIFLLLINFVLLVT